MAVGNYKEAIAFYKQALKSDDPSPLLVKLAIAYLQDQDQQQALNCYIEALATAKTKEQSPSDPLYNEALTLYLSGHNPRVTAQAILAKYPLGDTADSSNLSLITAAATANLNCFKEFFPRFYNTYLHNHDHWLSYKIRAALHLKLFSSLRDANEKQTHKRQALTLAAAALQRYSSDTSLYKWMMTLADEKERKETVSTYLQKIINDNIVVARSDITFFIQQAVQTDQRPLAQRFLNKAKEWYAFSRVITAAENDLDNQ